MPEPAADRPAVVTRTFGSDARVPSEARSFVRDAVHRLGTSDEGDISLLTSEATSNAVEHADSDAVTVSVERLGGRLRVTVADDDPTLPVVQPSAPEQPGGLGLQLIAHLAADWGVDEVEGDGKQVWFAVDLPGGSPPTT